MTTYRKIIPASSAVRIDSFPTYDEALTYSRSIGAHKPMRRIDPEGLRWIVAQPVPADALTDAKYIRVDDMVKASPAVPESVIMAALAHLFEREQEAIPA